MQVCRMRMGPLLSLNRINVLNILQLLFAYEEKIIERCERFKVRPLLSIVDIEFKAINHNF